MARIELEFHTEDAGEITALQEYWTLADDGETWAQTVTALRASLGLKPQELTQIVQNCGVAYLPEIVCGGCKDPHVVTSRTNYAEVLRQGNIHCGMCRAAAQAKREQEARELAARKRALLAERFPLHDTEPIQVADLSLFEAVALHAMFSDPAVEEAGMTTPTDSWPDAQRWAPESLRVAFERRLVEAQPSRVVVHPDSRESAFVWEDDVPTGSHYLGWAGYYLLGPEVRLQDRAPRLLIDLNRVFREGPWPRACM
ncbi:hypothetical protein [Streptomyces sp. NPDC088348]|uniref:hypothetical protein n=1 Tax=Streptomyces sp. NPDC088348 TaxID=3365853 RepID=UPI0037FAEAE3